MSAANHKNHLINRRKTAKNHFPNLLPSNFPNLWPKNCSSFFHPSKNDFPNPWPKHFPNLWPKNRHSVFPSSKNDFPYLLLMLFHRFVAWVIFHIHNFCVFSFHRSIDFQFSLPWHKGSPPNPTPALLKCYVNALKKTRYIQNFTTFVNSFFLSEYSLFHFHSNTLQLAAVGGFIDRLVFQSVLCASIFLLVCRLFLWTLDLRISHLCLFWLKLIIVLIIKPCTSEFIKRNGDSERKPRSI